jgi:ribosomal protein L11 methylase PrmA
MKLSMHATWGDGDIAAKLLGIYEQELHDDLFLFAQNQYDEIIDVGSAEGYYAVGSALLFKGTHVRAYDTDPLSQKVLRENSELNNVSEFVEPCGICEHSTLIERTNDRRTLVILDCEGGEMTLLEKDSVINALKNSDLIVECHDFIHHNATGVLIQRLYDTHRIKIVYSGGRDPSSFPFLSHMPDSQRWLLINENRPTLMNWLVCSSKNPIS